MWHARSPRRPSRGGLAALAIFLPLLAGRSACLCTSRRLAGDGGLGCGIASSSPGRREVHGGAAREVASTSGNAGQGALTMAEEQNTWPEHPSEELGQELGEKEEYALIEGFQAQHHQREMPDAEPWRQKRRLGRPGGGGPDQVPPGNSSGFFSFIWLSDLHMDPLYGKDGAYGDPLLCAVPHAHAMGSYGCDSPPALVDAAMSSASEVARQSQPAFVLISGDFVRHDTAGMQPTQEAFVLGVIDSTAERAADAFGPMPTSIAPVLGNNDVVPANHLDITSETPFTSVDSIVPHPYLTLIARIWRRHGLLLTAEEEASFSHGGYYARLVAPRLRLLCLNTVVYSKSLWPTPEVMDPFGQLTWMRAQLAEAKEAGDRVFLAGHNPPTLQSYNPGAPCWSDGFISSYADAIEGFEVTVAAHLYGHTHSGELRAMTTISAPRGAPLMSQNSIVPTGKGAVDPSNPAFSRWLFNPGTLEIVDSIVYASDLPFAGGANVFELTITSLAELLGLRSLDNAQVEAMGSRLAESEGLWQSYWNLWYKGGVRQRGCNGGCRLQQSCLVLHPLDAAAYERCAFAPARDGKSTY